MFCDLLVLVMWPCAGRLTSPTIDPSRPLPYWDKVERSSTILITPYIIKLCCLTVSSAYFSMDPYTYWPMRWEYSCRRPLTPTIVLSTWRCGCVNWIYSFSLTVRMKSCDQCLIIMRPVWWSCDPSTYTAQLDMKGALQLIVHTASKYDDCIIVDFPHVKSSAKFNWVCGGKGPHGHHYVIRCAPDRVPVLPDNQVCHSVPSDLQMHMCVHTHIHTLALATGHWIIYLKWLQVHDSYSLFRSQKLDVEWSLDVEPHKEMVRAVITFCLYPLWPHPFPSATGQVSTHHPPLLQYTTLSPTVSGEGPLPRGWG